MSEKLDNWSLILAITAFVFSLIGWIISHGDSIVFGLIISTLVLFSYPIGLGGLIVGVVALTKGSDKKWKPILAIVLYPLKFIVSLLIFFLSMP
ncbi:MAG: hypothetical protein ABIA78_00500 [archaeon]